MKDETSKVYRPQWEDSPYNHFAYHDTLTQREYVLQMILDDYSLAHEGAAIGRRHLPRYIRVYNTDTQEKSKRRIRKENTESTEKRIQTR